MHQTKSSSSKTFFAKTLGITLTTFLYLQILPAQGQEKNVADKMKEICSTHLNVFGYDGRNKGIADRSCMETRSSGNVLAKINNEVKLANNNGSNATVACKAVANALIKAEVETKTAENNAVNKTKEVTGVYESTSTRDAQEKIKNVNAENAAAKEELNAQYEKTKDNLSEYNKTIKDKIQNYEKQQQSLSMLKGSGSCKIAARNASQEIEALKKDLSGLDQKLNSSIKKYDEKIADNDKKIKGLKSVAKQSDTNMKELCSLGKDSSDECKAQKKQEAKQDAAKTEGDKAASALSSPKSKESKQYMAELKKWAQEKGITNQLPSNCFRGAYGECSNYVASLKMLDAKGDTSMYNSYMGNIETVQARLISSRSSGRGAQ